VGKWGKTAAGAEWTLSGEHGESGGEREMKGSFWAGSWVSRGSFGVACVEGAETEADVEVVGGKTLSAAEDGGDGSCEGGESVTSEFMLRARGGLGGGS
jgi:hypothetical protein